MCLAIDFKKNDFLKKYTLYFISLKITKNTYNFVLVSFYKIF